VIITCLNPGGLNVKDPEHRLLLNSLVDVHLFQRQYYASLLPSVFVGLQDMDERRIKCIQNFMRKSAQTEQEVSHKLVVTVRDEIMISCIRKKADETGRKVKEKTK
jgi:hypothetical protein